MKANINIDKFHLWLNFGWYSGNEWFLLNIMLFNCSQDYPSKRIDHVTVFSVQVLKLLFAFGWHSY